VLYYSEKKKTSRIIRGHNHSPCHGQRDLEFSDDLVNIYRESFPNGPVHEPTRGANNRNIFVRVRPCKIHHLRFLFPFPLFKPSVGGNRARRVDADTTVPWVLSLPLPTTTRLLLLLAQGEEKLKLNNTVKETRKYSAYRRPEDQLLPSVLSSRYSVSVSLQGVHYL
jgi:hypothetical protein